jgi:FAD-linked oxidoreductase
VTALSGGRDWTNWSGLEWSRPAGVEHPRDAADVAGAVRRARAMGSGVKMTGAGHSFTAVAAPRGTWLVPDHLAGVVAVDRATLTVTVLAGTRLHDLNALLERLGLSLHNMGDIDEQTVAGAISTGTHGTGGVTSGLASQVAGLELVTGTGELLRATPEENADVLDLARVGLGALGVLTSVTLRVEPLFLLEATETPMSWAEALDGFDERTAAHHHVDAYWFPHTDHVLMKTDDRLDAAVGDAEPLPPLRAWVDDELLTNHLFGASHVMTNRFPRTVAPFNRVAGRLLSARTYSDVAHRVFTARRRVVFREMEYAVPRAAGLDALRACRRALEASDLRISFPVELRTAPADDVPLSLSAGRDTFFLAFHTHRDVDHRPYFALVEPILREHGGRPHWGKVHTLGAAELAPLYPRFEEFLGLRDRLDPDRVFANPYLETVLGP